MAGVAATLVYVGIIVVPPSWSPWGPLDLTAEPGAFTRIQLASLREEPGTCFDALEKAGIRFTPQPQRPVENGCGLVNTARVGQVSAAYSDSFVATCPLLAALHLFERHVLDPAARSVRQAGEPVTLSTREFDLLQAFMLSANRVLSREQLEQQLYSWGQEVESNAIEVHIHNLRRKLGSGLIHTVRGVGYMLQRDAPSA